MSESLTQSKADEQFLVAPVVYYRDIARDNEAALILAYLVEIVVGEHHGLGLVARKELTEEETSKLDEFGKRLVANPYRYLHDECDRVWNDARPGEAIKELSASHFASLLVEPPEAVEKPSMFANDISDGETLVAMALSQMLSDYKEYVRLNVRPQERLGFHYEAA